MKRFLLALIFIAIVTGSAFALISEGGPTRTLAPIATHTIQRGELLVTVTEQGTLESSNNTEIKCRVRGDNTIISVVESGTVVKKDQVLLRLETLVIDEEISEREKFSHLAKSTAARSEADVAKAEIAISEYLEGRYVSQLSALQKDLAIAKSMLASAKNRLAHTKMMAKSKYSSELEVEEREFAVSQAELGMKLTETRIEVLQKFTKKEELATLNGALKSAKALHKANVERAYADLERLKRARKELTLCVIKAPRDGIVIYPKGRAWGETPDVEEGATVHKDQTLLLMPDLTRMQVKVGIHESVVDRIKVGMNSKVTLPGRTIDGDVSYVASVAKPAGWWTGNVVKYETIVELPSAENLKPGMSVEVEVILAKYEDELLIPTSAVIEVGDGRACWVVNGEDTERRVIKVADRNEMFAVVESGLKEGDKVVLDPLASVEEAQIEAAKSFELSDSKEAELNEL